MSLSSPADGHTCDLQVVHLATEPGTPGQPGGLFPACLCVHAVVGGFLKGSIKVEGR